MLCTQAQKLKRSFQKISFEGCNKMEETLVLAHHNHFSSLTKYFPPYLRRYLKIKKEVKKINKHFKEDILKI